MTSTHMMIIGCCSIHNVYNCSTFWKLYCITSKVAEDWTVTQHSWKIRLHQIVSLNMETIIILLHLVCLMHEFHTVQNSLQHMPYVQNGTHGSSVISTKCIHAHKLSMMRPSTHSCTMGLCVFRDINKLLSPCNATAFQLNTQNVCCIPIPIGWDKRCHLHV